MATSKNDKPPKIMDVTRPGRAAPPASAKPIIVTNRPMLRQDPMMTSPDGMEKETPAPTEETPISRVAKPINVIAPLAEGNAEQPIPADTSTDPAKPATAPGLPPKPESPDLPGLESEPSQGDKPAAEPEPTTTSALPAAAPAEDKGPDVPAAAETKPAEPTTPDQNAASGEPSAPATPSPTAEETTMNTNDESADDEDAEAEKTTDGQLAPNQALDDARRKEEEAKAAQLAELDKLAASKKYFLPIEAVEQRRGLDRALLILALVLVLALVWVDVMLDAGLLHLGALHALTNFFAN